MDANGHAAIVTGGASGLGAATARALAAAGAKVALFDVNEAEGASVANEISGLFIPCNVADAESVERAVAAAKAPHGAARILVTRAGIAPAARILARSGPRPPDA